MTDYANDVLVDTQWVQDHLDEAAVADQRLVHRVVENLPQAVHEAAAVGGADVHAGPLADRLQAFQHRQVACRVGAGGVRRGCDRQPGGGGGFGSHGSSPPMGGGRGRPELVTGLDGRLAATGGLRGEPRRRITPLASGVSISPVLAFESRLC